MNDQAPHPQRTGHGKHGDTLHARAHHSVDAASDPLTFWEDRYRESPRVWSGRVNATLAAVVSDFTPGRSLDLGCGEGGDAIWLAERGWQAEGIDLSQTAIDRATSEAERRGVVAVFTAADLGR